MPHFGELACAASSAHPTPPSPPVVARLDAYVSNLWSACGIERLLSSWTGKLLRVRRSSDNAEQDIGALPDLSLDLAALGAFVGSDSAYVVRVYDQSGAGNDFAQATAAKQPRLVNAGAYDGVIRWDGTDDILTSVGALPANAALSVGLRYAMRSVASSGKTHTVACHVNFASAGRNTFGYQQQNNSGKLESYIFTGASTYLNNSFDAAATTERAELIVFDRALSGTARTALFRNGSTISVSATNSGSSAGNFTAEALNVGSDGVGQPSPMNAKWLAAWANSQASGGLALSAAL